MNKNTPVTTSRNPYTIWFVVLAFVAPVVLAYVMYFTRAISTYTNHGEILNPLVDISKFELKDESGKAIDREQFTRQWVLISFVGKDCDGKCNARLYDSRQVHKSLGDDQERIDRMIIHLEPPSEELTNLISTEYPKVINVYGDEQKISDALGEKAQLRNNVIYIMDPIGNVMMRFTQDQSKKDLKADLKKLLKVSQIG
jgi:cytochrome oxidase Cu insertion factor (SCO1/SenC/PrrC family)